MSAVAACFVCNCLVIGGRRWPRVLHFAVLPCGRKLVGSHSDPPVVTALPVSRPARVFGGWFILATEPRGFFAFRVSRLLVLPDLCRLNLCFSPGY